MRLAFYHCSTDCLLVHVLVKGDNNVGNDGTGLFSALGSCQAFVQLEDKVLEVIQHFFLFFYDLKMTIYQRVKLKRLFES